MLLWEKHTVYVLSGRYVFVPVPVKT